MSFKSNILLNLTKISLYCFPISLMIGSLIVNLNILIFIVLGITFSIFNKIKFHFNLINISLLMFFFIIIISSYINLNEIGKENFIKSILLIKFYLFYIVFENLCKNSNFEFKYFFYICFYSIIFLSFDLSLQYFYGKNILGFAPHEGRIAGIFGHEAVAGAYLQKIFLFSLIGMFFFLNLNNKKDSLFLTLALSLIIFGSFIASNRISFFILILLIFFLILFLKIIRKNLIYAVILVSPIMFTLYQNDASVNIRYNGFIIKTSNLILNIKDNYLFNKDLKNVSNTSGEISNENLKSSKSNSPLTNHGKIFLTAFESFKTEKLIGNGYKSFRIKCFIFTEKSKDYLCSTHPHNYHLEVLHDTGLIGFVTLSFFVISLIALSFKRLWKTNMDYNDKIIIYLLILNLLIELFPLKSTGSLFTTWNGSLVWLTVALVNYKIHEINNKKIF